MLTNFRHHQAFCPKCNRHVIKAAEGELVNCHIGPTTKAAAVFLRYGLRIPYRKVKELFDVFFNIAVEKAEILKQRLINPKKEYYRLFTFLDYPNVQPTNNQAEQSLRNMVIFRKICFGTRSAEGSHFHSILPSLLLTARRQGKHSLDFFKILFTSDTATSQAALYQNSS